MPSAPAPVALGEAGHWGKGTWETLRVWGGACNDSLGFIHRAILKSDSLTRTEGLQPQP